MPKSIAGERMVTISVHLPRRLLERVDELVRQGLYPNRSEAIRTALVLFLKDHEND